MVVVTTSETQRCDNVVTTLFDVATKIQSKPNVVTTSCASWVETHNELTIHQRILQVLMTEIYKIVNGVAPRIMNSLSLSFEVTNSILEIFKYSQPNSEEQ